MATENICTQCGKTFKNNKTLQIHTNKYHVNNNNSNNNNNNLAESMHSAFGADFANNFGNNFANSNTLTTVNGKPLNGSNNDITKFMGNFNNPQITNNVETVINGKKVKLEDIPYNLQKVIQDSMKQAFGDNYVDPFQNMNNQNSNDDSDSSSDSSSEYNSDIEDINQYDLDLQNKIFINQATQERYNDFISDFLNIILILEIISQEVESEGLRKLASTCTENKIRLHNVLFAKEKLIKEREEFDILKAQRIKERAEKKLKKKEAHIKLLENRKRILKLKEELRLKNIEASKRESLIDYSKVKMDPKIEAINLRLKQNRENNKRIMEENKRISENALTNTSNNSTNSSKKTKSSSKSKEVTIKPEEINIKPEEVTIKQEVKKKKKTTKII
jgi:hypothetical protein